jgi:hypothetical protein
MEGPGRAVFSLPHFPTFPSSWHFRARDSHENGDDDIRVWVCIGAANIVGLSREEGRDLTALLCMYVQYIHASLAQRTAYLLCVLAGPSARGSASRSGYPTTATKTTMTIVMRTERPQ